MPEKKAPSENSRRKIELYVIKYREKTGTTSHPDKEVEKSREWNCACDEMKKWKYCHCLLFVTPDGLPITEYLPEDHEGRKSYGLVKDPTPGKGREGVK